MKGKSPHTRIVESLHLETSQLFTNKSLKTWLKITLLAGSLLQDQEQLDISFCLIAMTGRWNIFLLLPAT